MTEHRNLPAGNKPLLVPRCSVALAGCFWEIASGAPGAFTLIGFVGGTTHLLATVILRRRL